MSKTVYYIDPETLLEHPICINNAKCLVCGKIHSTKAIEIGFCMNEWSELKSKRLEYVQKRTGFWRLNNVYCVIIVLLICMYAGLELSGIYTPLNILARNSITSPLILILVGALAILIPQLIRGFMEQKIAAEFLEHNPRMAELDKLYKQLSN